MKNNLSLNTILKLKKIFLSNLKDHNFKIAFVKEEGYQDLWVGDNNSSIKELLCNTHRRIGPLSLLTKYETDFYIVNQNKSKIARCFRKRQLPFFKESDYELFANGISHLKYPSATNLVPKKFSRDVNSIIWNKYDIVISINLAVPYYLRRKFPSITWICIPGEGLIPSDWNGWDFFINHNVPNSPYLNGRIINMPYTYIEKNIFEKFFPAHQKEKLIYVDPVSINNPELDNLKKFVYKSYGIELNFHPDNTELHIRKLLKSKYFLKLGGRPTRGNSFLEAMAAGCICFAETNSIFGNLSLPNFCYFKNLNELCDKLHYCENNEYFTLDLKNKLQKELDRIHFSVNFQLREACNKKTSNDIRRNNKSIFKIIISIFRKLISNISYTIFKKFTPNLDDPHLLIPPLYED